MSEHEEIDEERWRAGWRHEFKDAVDAALAPFPEGTEREIETIWVKKIRHNPVHDYRIVLRP